MHSDPPGLLESTRVDLPLTRGLAGMVSLCPAMYSGGTFASGLRSISIPNIFLTEIVIVHWQRHLLRRHHQQSEMTYVNGCSVIGIGVIFPFLGTVSVALRFAVKRAKKTGLGIDDWLILLGLVSYEMGGVRFWLTKGLFVFRCL